ncbi:hypothetical protein C7S13_8218 [Burkholderia cepacia]|nr:hypothetical protein [Burkholderia cepacia]
MFDGPRSAAPLPDIASKRFGRTRALDAARFARSARQRRLPDSCVSYPDSDFATFRRNSAPYHPRRFCDVAVPTSW